MGPRHRSEAGPKEVAGTKEGSQLLICQWGETRQVCKEAGGLCPMGRYAHHTDDAKGPPPPIVLNRMILLLSRGNVPWTMVHGQPRMLTKILMTAAVKQVIAPMQKQKIAMARASSIRSTAHRQAKHRTYGRQRT